MAEEESLVGKAVVQLGQSLNSSEEATIHAKAMVLCTEIMFVRYRLALGDEATSSGVDVSGKAERASQRVKSAIDSLEAARAAIRDFALSVAPALQLTESSEDRSVPVGEELLDTSNRPKSLKSLGNRAASAAPDVGDLWNSAADVVDKVILTPPTPPDISGAATNVPHFQVSETLPTGVAPQKIVGTIALSVAVAVKAGAVVADKIMTNVRKFFDRDTT